MDGIDFELLKIDINYVIKYLYSNAITKNDINKLENYIRIMDIEELKLFKQIAEKLKHDKKYYDIQKYKITSNSINLSIKIYEQTSIKTFPYINKIASKGWSISDGTFAWEMYLLDTKHANNTICSNWRAYRCLQKRFNLKHDLYNNFDVIELIDTQEKQPEIERWA